LDGGTPKDSKELEIRKKWLGKAGSQIVQEPKEGFSE